MVRYAPLPVVLAASVLLAACGENAAVDPTNTQAGVLPGTEGSRDFGDYVVYFNSLKTDQLTPEIAQDYGIVRSPNRALLTVSIHRKQDGGPGIPTTGAVTASAVNLNGQLKNMTLREIREGEAIYYIGELAITDGEVLIYTIDVTPTNDPSRYTVRFQKQFFID
ncbi:MAG TPA: DUF4426 domain-containing protein [Gammaproteobacteria bacterium]